MWLANNYNGSFLAPFHLKQLDNIIMDLRKVIRFYNTLSMFIHWKFVLTNGLYKNATLVSFIEHMRKREISNHGRSDVTYIYDKRATTKHYGCGLRRQNMCKTIITNSQQIILQ